MDRTELFNAALYVASRLVEKGAGEDALVVLRLLAEDEAYGDVRVIACTNCALVSTQLGRNEDALGWYDRGIALERPGEMRIASRYKAQLYADLGRPREALELYLALLAGPLIPKDEEAIRQAVAALEAAAG
jgi:tetratricopeptide (TPR) repeat protein